MREWRDVVLTDVGSGGERKGVRIIPVFVFDAGGVGEPNGAGVWWLVVGVEAARA